jgi:hypothetical protein
MESFKKGVVTGLGIGLALVLIAALLRFFYERDRKIYEYMEAQSEIQVMREDLWDRPVDEFLAEPGVRGAADKAGDEFRRKRDEAIQRIRGGYAD